MGLLDGNMGDLISEGFEKLSVPEVMWSMYEVALNRDSEMDTSPAVDAVIREAVATEAGISSEEDPESKPFYPDQFMEDSIMELKEQLSDLGVTANDAPYLKAILDTDDKKA
jgi:hypothetical protein